MARSELPIRDCFREGMRGFRPQSHTIERVVFDDDAAELRIWFRRSGAYLFKGVPRSLYEAMKAAASAGRFFNATIKGRFACEPLNRRFRPQL